MKLGSMLAAVLLSLVAVAHLLRVVFRWDLMAGGVAIPTWVSVLGFLIPVSIVTLLVRESQDVNKSAAG